MDSSIKAIVSDFSRVLLFPIDPNYTGGLNALSVKLNQNNKNYNFLDYFRLNNELLDTYQSLNQNLPVHIFISDTIQDHPAIKETLKHAVTSVLSAKKLEISKTDPSSYEIIAEIIGMQPEEILYIDDQAGNLAAATMAGMKTILYTDNTALLTLLRNNILDKA